MGKIEVYCPACGVLFKSEEEMLEHYDKVHDDSQETEAPESLSGMIRASTIVNNKTVIGEINGKYTVIYDQALMSIKFDNLVRAVNIMAENGWKCINITSYNNAGSGEHIGIPILNQLLSQSIYMYALMEKVENNRLK